jgi:hypothetical protein
MKKVFIILGILVWLFCVVMSIGNMSAEEFAIRAIGVVGLIYISLTILKSSK